MILATYKGYSIHAGINEKGCNIADIHFKSIPEAKQWIDTPRIGDRVKLIKTGDFGTVGTIEDTITDHVTGTIFYIVHFDNGEFDTYAANELKKEKQK